MKRIKQLFDNFINCFKDENVGFEYKSFYMFALFAIPGTLLLEAVLLLIGADKLLVSMLFATTLLIVCITYILNRFEEIAFIKYFVSILINVFVFPLFFILTGDIYGGAIMFFPLGIITTFLIIKEKTVYLVAPAQIAWYCYILFMYIKMPERFTAYEVSGRAGIGVMVCFPIIVCIVFLVLFYQSGIYAATNKKLAESKKIIDDAKLNKSRFLANMTHEIRTPMNSIVGMNELILREKLTPETQELAENIKNSSSQLLKIINNILEFSKLDSNRMNLSETKYDLKKLLTEIIESVSVEYLSEENEFYVKIDPDIPQFLFGDPSRIRQIFMYILFSKINRLPHNRITMNVSGDIDRTTNTCLLKCTIAESGIGMSRKEIDAMLSAYTRYDSRQKTDFQDMGLELSICKDILEKMGGSLEIDSVEDVGISVRFEFVNYIIDDMPIVKLSAIKDYSVLVYCRDNIEHDVWGDVLSQFQVYPTIVGGPNAFRNAIERRKYTHIFVDEAFYPILKDTIREAELSDILYIVTEANGVYGKSDDLRIIRKPLCSLNVATALNGEWKSSSYKLAAKKESVIFPQAKVLIVDDSLVNIKVLEGMLSTFKISAKSAKSGGEALRILENEEFDLLIFDQKMPGMDGIELLHYTKGLDNVNALVPVICATADFGPEIEEMLKGQGFSDYLAKPVRRHYLERALRKFIPPELAENIIIDETEDEKHGKKGSAASKQEAEKIPAEPVDTIHFDEGLNNVGGSMDAFASVILAYYNEGLRKLEVVPKMHENDLPNYIIEVHALKSSSAAIGAREMSVKFKELEFAGRSSNTEFIQNNSDKAFTAFEKVLQNVFEYMKEKGIYKEDKDDEPKGDEMKLEPEIIKTLIGAMEKFNLRFCEDKLKELSEMNFGREINDKIKELNATMDMFDYRKVKDELNELLNNITNGG